MKKGRIIIDFESDGLGKCNYNIIHEGKDKLDDENLKNLLEHVLGELIAEEF